MIPRFATGLGKQNQSDGCRIARGRAPAENTPTDALKADITDTRVERRV